MPIGCARDVAPYRLRELEAVLAPRTGRARDHDVRQFVIDPNLGKCVFT